MLKVQGPIFIRISMSPTIPLRAPSKALTIIVLGLRCDISTGNFSNVDMGITINQDLCVACAFWWYLVINESCGIGCCYAFDGNV